MIIYYLPIVQPHQDGPAYYPVVAILSLGSPVVMDFIPHSSLRLDKSPRSCICTKTETWFENHHSLTSCNRVSHREYASHDFSEMQMRRRWAHDSGRLSFFLLLLLLLSATIERALASRLLQPVVCYVQRIVETPMIIAVALARNLPFLRLISAAADI